MNIKKIWKSNLESFKDDMVYLNRFARHDDPYLEVFNECLYNNEIKMRGNEKKVKYSDFTKIDFMGPEIDHPEWIQQLNRFYWMKYCAIEYDINKSDHMAKLVYDAINAWMEYWPYYGDRSDIFGWCCCELFQPMISTPIRLGAGAGHGWIGCLPSFFNHRLFTDEFIQKVTESILWQLEPMIVNNKYHSGEHNWRPNELSCLIFASQVIPGAEKHTEYAVEQLNDAFMAQFEEDGSHIEHTTDYHDWMTDVFALIHILGQNRPELGFKIDPERILKALDYGLICKAPDGRQMGIHDSYSWHPDNPVESDRNLIIRDKIAEMCGNKCFVDEYSDNENFRYDNAGQFYFYHGGTGPLKNTDGGTGPVEMLYFDASNWGSWHTHQSKNSLNFFLGNKMLLIDPGSLDYGNSADRWYGKLTPAHNTVSINNLSQCPFSDPLIREYYADDKLVFMISDYSGGYQDWCGPGNIKPEQGFYGDRSQITAAHERIFIWIKGKFILVFDSINLYENVETNRISSHWQFLKGDAKHDSVEQTAHTEFNDYNVLIKKVFSNIKTTSQLYFGETEPMLGYNSRTGGKLSGATPAPMFSIEAETKEDLTRIGQLIIPYTGTGLPSVDVSVEENRYGMMFSIALNDEKYDIASHYFKREYLKSNSAIREIGVYNSRARAFIKGYKDNTLFLDWTYRDSSK